VPFKFVGVEKHCLFASFVLFICLFCLFLFIYIYIYIYIYYLFVAMLLIGHDLHHSCRLCVIGVFNLFEHCISLAIPIFDSCVGLERLHLFD
jgi:hypothetical protein